MAGVPRGAGWAFPLLAFIVTAAGVVASMQYPTLAVVIIVGGLVSIVALFSHRPIFAFFGWLSKQRSEAVDRFFIMAGWSWGVLGLVAFCSLWAYQSLLNPAPVLGFSNQASARNAILEYPAVAMLDSEIRSRDAVFDFLNDSCSGFGQNRFGVVEGTIFQGGQAYDIVSICWQDVGGYVSPPCFEEITYPKYRKLPIYFDSSSPSLAQDFLDARSDAWMRVSIALVAKVRGAPFLAVFADALEAAGQQVGDGPAQAFAPEELDELNNCISELRSCSR